MKIKSTLLSIFILSIANISSIAQRNTPSGSNYPFPQSVTYSYGIKPTNINISDVTSAYDTWRSTYASNCGSGKWRINADDPNVTFSEGIGYGMLLSAYSADKTLFDGLWAYYKQFSNSNGIMNWKINGCTSVNSSGGATDGDLDAAIGLYIAHYQWGSAGTVNYLNDSKTLINNIMAHEVNQSNWNLLNGDGWGGTGLTCYNPSYWAPAYYRVFKTITGDTKWDNVLARCYVLYNANKNGTTGLTSNWCDSNGAPSSCAGGIDYGWDACRAPWRMATDVIWNGNATSKSILNTMASFWNGKGAANVSGPMPLTGGTGQYHVGTFIGTWAAGTVGCDATYQSHCNEMYTENKNWVPGANNYFNSTLRLIGMFVQSGNFYLPPLGPPPATCTTPSLGNDVSLCGVGSVTLTANAGVTTNKTYKWYLGSSSTSLGSSSTYTSSSAGIYRVVVDSSGVCSRTDTIVVSATMPTPNLGADKKLCSPSNFTLDAGVSSSGITYSWKKAGVVISGETNKTLTNIREAGTYTVTLTANGCSSTSDDIIITSDLPTPVDGCNASAGSVYLSITGGTGPFSWYAVPTNGSELGTGTTFNTPSVSTTTTYYVEAGGAQISATAGLSTKLNGGWQVNGTNDKGLTFDAIKAFTLNQVTVYAYFYSSNENRALTVFVENSSGTKIATKDFTLTGSTQGEAKTLTLDFNIPVGTGYKLKYSGNTDLYYVNTGATYPYLDNANPAGSVLKITGNNPVSEATGYSTFYSWKITSGTTCSRLPVVATIGGACAGIAAPVANFSSSNTSVCQGSSITFTNSSTGTINSYLWNFGVGATPATASTAGPHSVSWSSSGSKTISLTVSGPGGSNVMTSTVVVNALPQATITAGGSLAICSGSDVTLTANSGNGLTYQWKKDLNNIVSETASTYKASSPGSYTVAVTSNGCTSTSSGSVVTVIQSPSATITAGGTTTFCDGGNVKLTANSGNGLSYQWKKDNQNIPLATQINYTVTSSGNYAVVVTSNSCSATSQATGITVIAIPEATITPDGSTTFCTGGNVKLSASTGVNYTYEWKKDNGIIQGETGNSFVATQAGDYIVKVSSGNCSSTSSVTNVIVNALPSASMSASGPTTFCSGGNVKLTANSGAGYSYQWKRNGNNLGGEIARDYNAIVSGKYSVEVSKNGCSTISSETLVTVSSISQASISASSPTIFCDGDSVVLLSNATNGISCQWKKDGKDIVGATTKKYAAKNSGSYSVVNSNGVCNSSSSMIDVSAMPLPIASISSGDKNSFCEGGNIQLNANEISGYTYQWKKDNAEILGETDPVFFATEGADFSVTVSMNNCSATSQKIKITEDKKPTKSVAGSDQTIIVSSANLKANIPVVGSGKWSVVGGMGIFSDDTNPTTSVSELSEGANVFKWAISNGECPSSESQVTIFVSIPTGVNYELENKFINIFPNPTSGIFTIEKISERNDKLQIVITDLLGNIILNVDENNKTMMSSSNINMSAFPTGVYFIKAISNNRVEIIKILKE